jgi:hypothetical protein
MSKLHAVFAMLALTLTLGSAGCDDDEASCGEAGECRVDPPTPRTPKNDEPGPAPCAQACANLLGDCDGNARITVDAEIAGCEQSCRADFSVDEIECLASLSCGEDSETCL